MGSHKKEKKMAIPDFQSILHPLFLLFGDEKEHTRRELIERLANEFDLSDKDLKELLPSGRQPIFSNRVSWAITHLKIAKLIENTRRGVLQLTSRGKDLIEKKPVKIDKKFLMQFPEYAERRESYRRNSPKKAEVTQIQDEIEDSTTPEEQIEEAFENLNNNLSVEILSLLKESGFTFFEKIVIEVLLAMGYGGSRKDAGEAIGKIGDEGIDGIIKEDRLGLDIIYIQAKKWGNTVSRPEIQKFAGALQGKRARKGIFITTSDFSKGAQEYVESIESKIILIDGKRLAQLMIDFNVGLSTEAIYELKKIDSDYFSED